MKVVVIGNLACRNKIQGKKKETILAGGSYFAALQAARMGHDVTLVSKLSSKFPQKWLKKLQKEKIKIIKQPAWEYTNYDVNYHKDGTKTAQVHSDAGPIMGVPKLDADLVLISSYIGYIGIDVLKTLKTKDNVVALDSQGYTKYKNPAGELSYVPWLEKEEFLKYVDILKLNASELYYLTGKSTLHSASELLALGPKVVTLTLGMKGAYVFYGKKKYMKVPVFENKEKFIDKAGVGDAYTMAFAIKYKETLDKLKKEADPEKKDEVLGDITESSYFAAAAASFAVEKKSGEGIANLAGIKKRFKTLKEIFLV